MPKPHFVGYLPKRTGDADKTLAPFGVINVASVSNCISSAPDDWVEHWKHNHEGFYDTEERAMSILPSSDAANTISTRINCSRSNMPTLLNRST